MIMTKQQKIKKGYRKIVIFCGLLAVLLLTSAFTFTPEFRPTPYHLEQETMEMVDIPDDIEIPPMPQEIKMPKVPYQMIVSDDASDDETIEDTSWDNLDDMPLPRDMGKLEGPKTFYAFDEAPVVTYKARPRSMNEAKSLVSKS